MDHDRQTTGHRGRLALSALVLLAVGGLLTTTILAAFTDTATSTNNTFTSGDVDITAAPVTSAVTLSGMVPGSRVTAPIDVGNSGSLQLRYAVESLTTEDPFASTLVLTVKSGLAVCNSATFDGGGTVVAVAGPVGTMAGMPLIGDATQGQDLGDRILGPGASERLCFDVVLPVTTGNAAQSGSTTATFTFLAEQTALNP